METSTARPMLGHLTADRFGTSHVRWMKPANSDYRRLQVKAARRDEARLIAADLADERLERIVTAEPDEIHNDWASYLADVNADADLFADPYGDDIFTDAGLDPATATYGDLLDTLELDDTDPCFDPYGQTFDPDDIQWGFRVTSMDKAPGVTSGRPQPTHLAA